MLVVLRKHFSIAFGLFLPGALDTREVNLTL